MSYSPDENIKKINIKYSYMIIVCNAI